MLLQISAGSQIAIGLALAGAIAFGVIAGYEVHHLSGWLRSMILAGVVVVASTSVYLVVIWLAQH